MLHLIPVKENGLWLVNNRIDFNTWNELYKWNGKLVMRTLICTISDSHSWV